MIGDLPEVALRLSSELPSRRHEWQPPVQTKKEKTQSKPRIVTGRGRGGHNRKAIIIQGKRFASAQIAREMLCISNRSIKKMLGNGLARRP